MDEKEKKYLKAELYKHRKFLRLVNNDCDSVYKLTKILTDAKVEELHLLVGILRMTVKGEIPVKLTKYNNLKKTRSFKKLVTLTDLSIYESLKSAPKKTVLTFLKPFQRQWRQYIDPLFDIDHPGSR